MPTGPIPEMVPAASAAEAREAPRERSWWDRVADAVSSALSSIGAGLGALTSRVLGAIARRVRDIPGYGLLSVALGKDPVTGQAVPRTPVNVIGGLVGLIPGGAAIFANLQASGAVARAAAWFGTAWEALGLTWDYLRGLFRRAWDTLGLRDLLDPAGAWAKLQGVFGPPLQRLKAFAVSAASKLLELVFEGGLSLAGPLGGQVMGVIRRAGSVLQTIYRDPVGFVGKLVAAVRGGLGQFARRIGHHLQLGLFGWLTGALRGAVTLPERFDLRGILSLVLQVLGATWAWFRTKLVRLLGEERVAFVERAVDWVQRIATEGLSAVWERIAEYATGLVDTVIDGIKDWVGRSVVGAAIVRLVSMFNPAGAIIQAIIAAYNTVKFFIERAQQIGALADAVFGSVAAIASGALGNAMNAVENALSRALPVAIGFLARLIGLGDVATPVKRLIERARGVVDRAMDRVVDRVKGLGRRIGMGRLGAAVSRQIRRGSGTVRDAWRRLIGLRRAIRTRTGERHTLLLRRNASSVELVLASAPTRLRDLIASITPKVHAKMGSEVDIARRFADESEALAEESIATGKDNAERIAEALALVAPIVVNMLNARARKDLRTTQPTFAGLFGGFGRGVRVTLVSDDPLPDGGKPTVTNDTWEVLRQRRTPRGKSYYVRGHLLSQELGGSGSRPENLAPLSRSGNARHHERAEGFVKQAPGTRPRAFIYVVTAAYGRGTNEGLIERINDPSNEESIARKQTKVAIVRAEASVASILSCSIREVDPDSGEHKAGMVDATYPIENPLDDRSPGAYLI